MKSTHDTIEEVVEEYRKEWCRPLVVYNDVELLDWLRAALLRIHQAALERAVGCVPPKDTDDENDLSNCMNPDDAVDTGRIQGWNSCRAATLAALAKLKENT